MGIVFSRKENLISSEIEFTWTKTGSQKLTFVTSDGRVGGPITYNYQKVNAGELSIIFQLGISQNGGMSSVF